MKPLLKLRRAAARGFTLIEMMVVVAIVGIITSVIVWNYGDFRSGILTTNMAYEAATSVREAQLYGLGVRGAVDATDESGYSFGGTYGVQFHVGETTYEVFRDGSPGEEIPANGLCDSDRCSCGGGENEECVERVTLLQGVLVAAVCAGNSAEAIADPVACQSQGYDTLTVSFTRPRPESIIRVGGGGELVNPPPDEGFAAAGIIVRGGTHCRLVTVYRSGQVSVAGMPDNTCGQ